MLHEYKLYEKELHIKKRLNKFFVPINIANFDFRPYKIKLNVFILTKKIILFFVPNGYNFDVLLIFFLNII